MKKEKWKRGQAVLTALQWLLLFGLFLYSGPLLRLIDPTAASLDNGIAGILLLTVLVVDTFAVSAWLLVCLVSNLLSRISKWNEEENEFFEERTGSWLEEKIITGSFWGLVLLDAFVFTLLL